MELMYKDDWDACRARIDAWWQGEIVNRAAIKITARRRRVETTEPDADDLESYWTDPERVIPRLERSIEATYWAGEAFPVMFPVSTGMVAVLGSYLGCPLRFINTHTTWSVPIIEDWESRSELRFSRDNPWWRASVRLLQSAAARAEGRYYVGLPDLNGPGEILSRLRGPARLAIDLLENGDEVKAALDEVNRAWLRYWEAAVGIVHQYVGGYIHWMGIWSESPSTDLQCDFSCMISSEMFDEFFLPALKQQTEWVGRTLYHLDGPGAVRHLDSLLELPELDGIQWVPGAGAPPMREWVPLLRRIQDAGKLVYIGCEKNEVEFLLTELRPEGLLLQTHCDTVEEADALLKKVEVWTARRRGLGIGDWGLGIRDSGLCRRV